MAAIDELDARLRSLQKHAGAARRGAPGRDHAGYTHLQRAQPVLFAHHLLAYFEMFQRDRQRLADCHRRRASHRWGRALWRA